VQLRTKEPAVPTIEKRTTPDGTTSFRARVRLKGYQPETATFARITDAKRWAQQTEAAVREGRHFKTAEAKRHTLAEAIDRYVEKELPAKPANAATQEAQLLRWKRRIGYLVVTERAGLD
jgi:hypothetical protein